MVDIRKRLVDLSSRYPWGDVRELDWSNLGDTLKSPAEHCEYKFLAHVEGYAYSGRLKCVYFGSNDHRIPS